MDEQVANVAVNPLIEAIRVDVENMWVGDLPAHKTRRIRMTVHLAFAEPDRTDGSLFVTLTPRHRGGLVMKKRFARPDATMAVEFEAKSTAIPLHREE